MYDHQRSVKQDITGFVHELWEQEVEIAQKGVDRIVSYNLSQSSEEIRQSLA